MDHVAHSRRTFLKHVLALGGVSAGSALLNACAATGSTPTAATSAPTTAAATSVPTTAAPTAAATAAAAAPTAAQPGSAQTTSGIVAAGNAFLATLSAAEKQTGLFDWSNTAQKQRWSNFPPAGFSRAGLMWGNLNQTQQTAWLALMQATLSTEGYNRINAEWSADDALLAQEGTGGGFGKANYYLALIGTPSETDPWQWQFGGHHVTVNATISGPNLALTPSFIGVQPGTYQDASGKTIRPLGDIEDEGFALINALDATQQQTAVLGPNPIDLVLGPGQDGKTIQSEGILATQLNAAQRAALLKLIGHYTGLANEIAAAARLAEVTAALDQTSFAWYGPTTAGSAAYFRVTGPTLVIEFAPQGGGWPGDTSGATDLHVHGIYRDPTNDYGAKYTGLKIGA